jgi:predicted small lipoprotein YifL
MSKTLATILLGLALAAGPACGRKGPLELPQGRVPMAVERLTAVQRGPSVVLAWTDPVKTVSGRPLGPLGSAEVWVFDREPSPAGPSLTSAAVEASARLVRRVPAREPGAAMSFVYDPGPAGPERLVFTVRVVDAKGNASEFSPPAAVDLVRASAPVDRPAAMGVC